MVSVINRVTYPTLAKVKHDKELLISSYKKLIKHISFVVFVTLMILAAISPNMIRVLIGEKWMPAATYLTIMCFSAMLYPLSSLNLNLLKVLGRSDLFLKLEIIKKATAIPIIIVGVYYGIKAMLLAMIINSYFSYFLNCYYTEKLIQYGFIKQIKDLIPNFLMSFSVGIIVYLVTFIKIGNPIYVLGLQIFIAIITFIGLSVFTKNESFKYGVSLFNEYKAKFIKS